MEHRIARIQTKHHQELADIHGWNVTIQDGLILARRLQPGRDQDQEIKTKRPQRAYMSVRWAYIG